MNTIVFLAALAMLTMVNAAPLQEEQKNNLLSLLSTVADQKARKDLAVNVQQLIDDGSEADAESYKTQIKRLARLALFRNIFANEQQFDGESQAEAQFISKLLGMQANKQNGDKDVANAQFWHLIGHAVGHVIGHLGNALMG